MLADIAHHRLLDTAPLDPHLAHRLEIQVLLGVARSPVGQLEQRVVGLIEQGLDQLLQHGSTAVLQTPQMPQSINSRFILILTATTSTLFYTNNFQALTCHYESSETNTSPLTKDVLLQFNISSGWRYTGGYCRILKSVTGIAWPRRATVLDSDQNASSYSPQLQIARPAHPWNAKLFRTYLRQEVD